MTSRLNIRPIRFTEICVFKKIWTDILDSYRTLSDIYYCSLFLEKRYGLQKDKVWNEDR
jgi:hypothetical protein